MPALWQRLNGINGCVEQRPSRDDFQGINLDSVQAQNLMAWWPTWEPMANGQKSPQVMDYGPYGLHFQPSVNTIHVPDPQMGTCWFGQPNPAGIAGMYSGQAQARPYNNGVAGVDPVDFGSLPCSNGLTNGVSYMSTAWAKTGVSAQTLTGADTPPDMYIYSFDRNDNTDYPGHTLGGIMQIPNGGSSATETRIAATIYDNNTGNDPYGVQSLQVINDNLWHLICGIYMPVSAPGNGNVGLQWILVDGNIGFQGGTDNQGAGTQPFGFSHAQSIMGSPQDATHSALTPVYQVFGADDDGVSSPWQGYIADHRLYAFPIPPSVSTGSVDMLQVWMQLAAHMYAPDTRWELYRPTRQLRIVFGTAAVVFTAAVSGGLVLGGIGVSEVDYSPPASGGVVAGGVATSEADFAPAPAGGAVLGGVGAASPSYAPSPAGGVVLGGVAVESSSHDVASAGGTVLGGIAIESSSYVVASSGGTVLGGVVAGSPTFSATPAGGAVLGGAGIESSSYAPATAGGLVLGGIASYGLTWTAVVSGGMVLGGIAVESSVYTALPSGGTVLGGNAPGFLSWIAIASGGMVLGGVAAQSSGYAPVPSGGAILGGIATESSTYSPVPAGGAVLGGIATATVDGINNVTGSGGMVLGGIATLSAILTASSSGGMVLGGAAIESSSYTVSVSGGMVLGGIATASGDNTYTASVSGGLVLGGIAVATSTGTFTASASGGMVLGGRAILPSVFIAVASGGVVLGGIAIVSSGPTPIPPGSPASCGYGPPLYGEPVYDETMYGVEIYPCPTQDIGWPDLFQSISDYLLSTNIFGPGSVFWAIDPDSIIQWPETPSPYCMLVPRPIRIVGDDIGGGRFSKLWTVAVDVHVVLGNSFDNAYRDTSVVTSSGAIVGPHALAQAVTDKMEQAYFWTQYRSYTTVEFPRAVNTGILRRFKQTNAYVSVPISFEFVVEESMPSTWLPGATPPTSEDVGPGTIYPFDLYSNLYGVPLYDVTLYGEEFDSSPSQAVGWPEFFQSISDYLIAQDVFGPGSSSWAIDPDSVTQWPSGPLPFGLVVPLDIRPTGSDIGGGRFDKLWDVRLEIHVVVGNVYDQSWRDTSVVTSFDIGVGPYALIGLLVDRLDQAYVKTSDGDYSTCEFPRATEIGELRRFKQTNDYVSIPIVFEMVVRQTMPSTQLPSGTPPSAADSLVFSGG